MSNGMIQIKGLYKSYGRKRVLKDVHLDIGPGQIVGIMGLNGAGKTSLLKSILGFTAYRGAVTVLGHNSRFHRKQIMESLCFIADIAMLPKWLRVKNAIDFVEGVHPHFDRAKALHFIKNTQINLRQKIRTLSKGMLLQLQLAIVMAVNAKILILDEPTLGLDILSRKTFFRHLLHNYFTEEKTIIVTTHQIEDVEAILTHLVIIHEGKITLDCSMPNYRQRFTEVTANIDNIVKLQALKPLASHRQFGQVKFLFENQDKQQLSQLGELSIPSVGDVFVAKIQEEANYESNHYAH